MSNSEKSKVPKQIHRFMGVEREKIDWFPTIDYEKCNDCGDCVDFCAHGVFKTEHEKVVVDKPKNCVVFCRACLKMCPKDAMIFQEKKDVISQIKQIKAKEKKK